MPLFRRSQPDPATRSRLRALGRRRRDKLIRRSGLGASVAGEPHQMSKTFVVWYVGSVVALASIANDVLLMAFGIIESDLGLSPGEAGLMMSFFFLGSGLGQPLFGPLSDFIGRRQTIQICVGFFIVGAGVVYLADTLEMLLLGRLLQGIGCSMCQSVSRAILRDLYSGRELALQMARTFSVFALSPVLSPLLGAWMLGLWEWRSVLLAHLIAGIAVMAATALMFQETVKRPRLLSARRALKQVGTYFKHRQSAFFTIPATFSYAMLILVLSMTPGFLMTDLGVSAWGYALIFSFCIGFAIIPGQWFNRLLIRNFHIWHSSVILSCVAVIGQLGILLWIYLGSAGVWELASAMFLFSFLTLAQAGNYNTLCINPHPRIAGFVASLHGMCTQSLGALLCLLIFNHLIDNDPLRWIIVTLVVSIFALGLCLLGRRYLVSGAI